MQRLDWTGMRARVGELLEEDQESLTLPELLEIFPPDAGVVEVLGYVQIAHDDGHDVDEMLIDVIELPKCQVRPRDDEFDVSEFWGSDITHGENDEVEPETWEVPRVTFLSEQRRALRDRLPLGESSR
jgi:hypothetical protein